MFIIAGERRSGTSTLAKWIEAHPDLYIQPKLDQAYFVDDKVRGTRKWFDGKINYNDWWDNHSKQDYLESIGAPKSAKIFGEKSADYFFWDPCLERILKYTPDAKIILTFRNPVKRAWSHYWNEFGKGRETLSFNRAIETEAERSRSSDFARHHLSYLERGKYSKSLKRWLAKFPREQVHVVILEHLIQDPELELTKVYRFLGLDPSKGMGNAGKRYNNNWTTIPKEFWTKSDTLVDFEKSINNTMKFLVRSIYRDSYEARRKTIQFEKLTRLSMKDFEMDIRTKESLSEAFARSNNELEQLLKIKLDVWD